MNTSSGLRTSPISGERIAMLASSRNTLLLETVGSSITWSKYGLLKGSILGYEMIKSLENRKAITYSSPELVIENFGIVTSQLKPLLINGISRYESEFGVLKYNIASMGLEISSKDADRFKSFPMTA